MRFLLRSDAEDLYDAVSVVRDLSGFPKRISPVYVYDPRGTELFERQCETPEYYLRRAEADLLREHAEEIVEHCGILPMVELGAGTAEKTRALFGEYARRNARCDYFPIDVDALTLAASAAALVQAFPLLRVQCLATTYVKGLRALPAATRRLFLFLGSSIGNMEMAEIDALLGDVFAAGGAGDFLLLGADLDKDPTEIDRAYNDAQGYGAQSTLNMLHHLNWRYEADFRVDDFCYRSRYDAAMRRNEVRLESLVAQSVRLCKLDLTISFEAGECIEAEVMWKFDPEDLSQRLARAGFIPTRRWIHPVHRYALFLLRRA